MDFPSLMKAYLAKHLIHTPSYKTYLGLYQRHFSGWTEHRTRFEIQAWHQGLRTSPSEANKALGMLKACYGWAQRTGDATGKQAIWAGDNPARGVRGYKTFSRERVFSDVELRKFFMYLDFHYHKLSAYLTVVLCSACRMSEAREMKWEYVDFENSCWHKPITKNGRSQRLPLPTQALEAIRSMLPFRRECSPYVFHGLYGRPWSRSMAEKAWKKAAIDMGLQDLRLHDFRRTVATRVYAHTKDYQLVKAILNHFDGGPTAVYVRLNYEYIARELQANADRFWSLKQEVPYDDPSRAQPQFHPLLGQHRPTPGAGPVHHGRPDGPDHLLRQLRPVPLKEETHDGPDLLDAGGPGLPGQGRV